MAVKECQLNVGHGGHIIGCGYGVYFPTSRFIGQVEMLPRWQTLADARLPLICVSNLNRIAVSAQSVVPASHRTMCRPKP